MRCLASLQCARARLPVSGLRAFRATNRERRRFMSHGHFRYAARNSKAQEDRCVVLRRKQRGSSARCESVAAKGPRAPRCCSSPSSSSSSRAHPATEQISRGAVAIAAGEMKRRRTRACSYCHIPRTCRRPSPRELARKREVSLRDRRRVRRG